MNSLWTLLLILFSATSYSHQPEKGKVVATWGPFIESTRTLQSSDTTNSPVLFGLGLLAEADMSDKGGIEAGLFYFPKTYQRVFGTTHIVERIDKLSVPIGYRFWVTNKLSGAFAFSPSFSVGDYKIIYSNAPIDASTSARAITEYGIDLSIQYEIWTDNNIVIILDARYYASLSNLAFEDSNLYGMLVGVKYKIKE